MTAVTLDSVGQYKEMGVFTRSGGIEVARTPERMEELKRRIDVVELVGHRAPSCSPRPRSRRRSRTSRIRSSSAASPRRRSASSTRCGRARSCASEAQELGALTISAGTEVTGIDVQDGRVRAVHTDKGTIAADTVVIACGLLEPADREDGRRQHPAHAGRPPDDQRRSRPQLAGTVGEITFPIVRDMDTNMYERQHGGDLEVGSYAHRPILMDADDIPSIAASALSPTELPFTQDDFEVQMEQALELVPDVLGDETVGIRHAINGLLSLTPDGMPILGETSEVKGLWSVAAVWIKEAPGIARAVAEWMTHGYPEIDLHASDIARFYDHQKTRTHVEARSAEGFNKTYGIVHPMEQWESNRQVRLSPAYPRAEGARRGVLRGRRLGAAILVRRQREAPGEYGDRVMPRTAEWESRWWSPIINAEHLAMRERVAMVDLAAFAIFDVTGPGALGYLQGWSSARWTCRSVARSTRRCSPRAAGSSRT